VAEKPNGNGLGNIEKERKGEGEKKETALGDFSDKYEKEGWHPLSKEVESPR